jgi:hypothetical protein
VSCFKTQILYIYIEKKTCDIWMISSSIHFPKNDILSFALINTSYLLN